MHQVIFDKKKMKTSKLFLIIIFLNIAICSFSQKCGKLKINTNFHYNKNTTEIFVSQQTNSFEIKSKNNVIRFATKSFVQAAIGNEQVEENRGSFKIKDKIFQKYSNQTIDKIYQQQDKIFVEGFLIGNNQKIGYKIQISVVDNEINFEITTTEKSINRIFLTIPTSKNENFYGLGEQFTYLKLNGRYFEAFISEQGIGRGKQPITFLVDLVAKSAGKYYTTYCAIAWFFSTNKYSFSLQNSQYSSFDFKNKKQIEIKCFTNNLQGTIFFDDIKELIKKNAQKQGLMRALPDWAHKGAIVGMQGGTEKVARIYDSLKKYNTPITALWLQDWVGQRKTSFGKQLWWNWQLDTSHYHNWSAISTKIVEDSLALLAYINTFLVDVSMNPKHKVNLYEIAKQNNYLIKKPNGDVYLIPNTDFSAAMLDLTNPDAVKWFKNVVDKYLLSNNIKGWMADFGEALPYDAVLCSKQSAAQYHNIYPVEWAKLNREIIDSLPNGNDYLFFTRAGFSNSSAYSTLFWEGDQLVSWDKHDGLKSAVTGLLSSGLSGITLNHSDIGGYTAIANPLAKNIRSKELLWRWIELNAFGIVYRTHEGNLPDQNFQIYSDSQTMKHFSKYAQVFVAFFDYRKQLIEEACSTAMPIVRPMFLVFENDKECYNIEYDQFMLGDEFLIAPVLDKGKKIKKVYLPQGVWIDLWTGNKIESSGKYYKFEAPLGKIPVFYIENSNFGKNIEEKISLIK